MPVGILLTPRIDKRDSHTTGPACVMVVPRDQDYIQTIVNPTPISIRTGGYALRVPFFRMFIVEVPSWSFEGSDEACDGRWIGDDTVVVHIGDYLGHILVRKSFIEICYNGIVF